MKLSEIITAVRQKIGERVEANSNWTDDEIRIIINGIKSRIHGKMAEANPYLFLAGCTVTLPANERMAPIPYESSGIPKILQIYDITTDDDPGTRVNPMDYSMRDSIGGQGAGGLVFWSTDTSTSERKYRLTLVDLYGNDLETDDDRPEDIPVHLQRDILVFGTALEIASEVPSSIVEYWASMYVDSVKRAVAFASEQVSDQMTLAGQKFMIDEANMFDEWH